MTDEDQVHEQKWFYLNNIGESRYNMIVMRKVLEEILKNPNRMCQNCGGMRPEIAFKFKDHDYYFTCFKITKKNKTIAETDYKKMAEYFASDKRSIKRAR